MVMLGIFLMMILGYLLSNLPRKTYLRGTFLLGCLMLASEVWKQWTLTYGIYGGFYVVWYFPFQLCSIPMYLCPLMLWLPDAWQKRIQTFLMTFTLLGGMAVFLDTTGMHYPLISLTIHSYIWHYLLILLGSWSGFLWRREEVRMGWSEALPLWFGCLGMATLLNVVLWPKGEISMFYISPFEESSQIIVRDLALRWGIHVANLAYLTAMLAGSGLIACLWNLGRSGKSSSD